MCYIDDTCTPALILQTLIDKRCGVDVRYVQFAV